MKKFLLSAMLLCAAFAMTAQQTAVQTSAAQPAAAQASEPSTVYFIKDITPESLLKVYHALGVKPEGRVAVKISTGESEESNQLSPALIKDLVQEVQGTLVECNTAYRGNRYDTESHLREVAKRGYDKIAPVEIMDADGEIGLPMADTTHFKFDIVGKGLGKYDCMINLAHFKGHAMGGFGGVLKNQSIGVASRDGKALIHTAGVNATAANNAAFRNPKGQDAFIESMAGAAQAVHNHFDGKVIYIDVMNNMSVDCDCNGHPAKPVLKDMGILCSLNPVALDKACVDLVFTHNSTADDDSQPLIDRINRQHGTYILDYAEKIGLGNKAYKLIDITGDKPVECYNVYDAEGHKVLDMATSLDSLKPGNYIVNGTPYCME